MDYLQMCKNVFTLLLFCPICGRKLKIDGSTKKCVIGCGSMTVCDMGPGKPEGRFEVNEKLYSEDRERRVAEARAYIGERYVAGQITFLQACQALMQLKGSSLALSGDPSMEDLTETRKFLDEHAKNCSDPEYWRRLLE